MSIKEVLSLFLHRKILHTLQAIIEEEFEIPKSIAFPNVSFGGLGLDESDIKELYRHIQKKFGIAMQTPVDVLFCLNTLVDEIESQA